MVARRVEPDSHHRHLPRHNAGHHTFAYHSHSGAGFPTVWWPLQILIPNLRNDTRYGSFNLFFLAVHITYCGLEGPSMFHLHHCFIAVYTTVSSSLLVHGLRGGKKCRHPTGVDLLLGVPSALCRMHRRYMVDGPASDAGCILDHGYKC